MENLKVEYEFNLEDFKKMEEIEHSYFPNDNITKAEDVLKWYEKNNLTCIAVRNEANEIIASITILPLIQDIFEKIYNNMMNEADVISDQIENYENNKSYNIYLSAISIDKSYRNNYKLIITLLKGCINLFKLLSKRNIKIEKVMAEASTTHGEKICNKLLKMNYISSTNHDSNIYFKNGDEFISVIDKLERFLR